MDVLYVVRARVDDEREAVNFMYSIVNDRTWDVYVDSVTVYEKQVGPVTRDCPEFHLNELVVRNIGGISGEPHRRNWRRRR